MFKTSNNWYFKMCYVITRFFECLVTNSSVKIKRRDEQANRILFPFDLRFKSKYLQMVQVGIYTYVIIKYVLDLNLLDTQHINTTFRLEETMRQQIVS